MEQFFLVLDQVLVLTGLIILGILCARFEILPQQSLPTISKLIVKLCLPILIFHTTISSSGREDILNHLLILPYTAIIYVILFSVGRLVSRLLALPPEQAGIFRVMMLYGNVGFIGIPIVMCLHPQIGMICISVFTLIDQPSMWTLGVSLLQKEKLSIREQLPRLVSPALLSIFLALFFIFAGIRLPSVIDNTMSLVSGCTMPLSLLFLGASLFYSDMKNLLRFKSLYFLLLKMTVIPVTVFTLLRFLGLAENLAQILTILTGIPSLTIAPSLAQQYGADLEYTNGGVLLTTLFSMITLPLLILAINFIETVLF